MFARRPWLAVDCVVFDEAGRLLLIRRKRGPFKRLYALPGGFVELGETVEQAALRELSEETGLAGVNPRLVAVYSDPHRDPRRHIISAAFLIEPGSARLQAGDDASAATFVADWSARELGFDHAKIVADAVRLKDAGAVAPAP